MGSNSLPIPVSSSEITTDWVQQVTGHTVIQDGFNIEGNIQEGIGFMSSICRISYQTKNGESHHIIVKLLPEQSKWLEFALMDLSDEREIKFYTIVLPDLLKVVPELQENICVFYNGTVIPANPELETKRQSMIIMEDLKPLGFEMMSFAGNDSETVLQSLITFMARLHFGAFSVEAEKGIPLPKLYPFMQGISDTEEWRSQVESLSEEGYKLLEQMLVSQKMPSSVWAAYERLKPFTASILKAVEENGRKNPCLVHTDVWPPNIMIHNNLPVKVLDWQLLGYRDVAYDLSIMLVTAIPKENLTKDNLRKWIRRYYEEFESLCQNSKNGDKIKRKSWEDFEEFFFTWGAAFLYCIALPSVECYEKDYLKYAIAFKVLNDELHLPEFLEKTCGNP
ncbi:unnamed protein product [Orchesella dallaii]|uniref:CHK kinase-like domain-containing protein n=1 Tax=Orchesella dallaii TaxID=48710 RepID=A0ABP1RXE9_9HEXA